MDNMPDLEIRVTVGVDTHKQFHVAVALDQLGRRLDEITIPASREGYRQLLDWAVTLGIIDQFGIEGTGSYGAGLTHWLRGQGLAVVEVDRPERRRRHQQGKSDAIDAEAAARAVLAGQAVGVPKTGDGAVEIRVLRIARRSAVHNRTMATNELAALVITAPADLREQLVDLSARDLVATAARFRPGDRPDDVRAATRYAMRELARRCRQLDEQIARLATQLNRLVAAT